MEEEESKATVDRIRNKFSKRKIVDADGNDEYNVRISGENMNRQNISKQIIASGRMTSIQGEIKRYSCDSANLLKI